MNRSVFVILFALLASKILQAHEMGLETKIKGRELVIEVFYEDDTPAQDTLVNLKDESGKVIETGRTNLKGICIFSVPKEGRYHLEAKDNSGHQVKVVLKIPSPQKDVK